MLLRTIFLLAVCLPLLFPAVTIATVLDQVREDFRPVAGYVIMPVNGSYLIDLDADSGVRIGDLFTVIRKGEKIIHPVTKEVLGTLDEVRNVLQVTRIKSGYSYARPVGKDSPEIAKGEEVSRYANLKATFWDYTGQGEEFYADLKSLLPQLEWPDYEAAQAARPANPEQAGAEGSQLHFVLRHDGLQVRGPDLEVMRSYPAPESVAAQPPAPAVPPPAAPHAAAPSSTPVKTGPVTWERGAADEEGERISFPNFRGLGRLPAGTVMADFVESGGRLLLAVTEGTKIQIFEVGEKPVEVASGDTARPGEILSVHWWEPEAGGPLYLAATYIVELNEPGANYVGHKPVGAVFRLERDRLVSVRESLGYMPGSFDRDGDGRRETLLGQRFDRDTFFGQVKELRLAGEKIEARALPFDLPRLFAVQGSAFADLTGDGSPETVTVRNRTLYIHSGQDLLYQSRQQVGGSISQMEYYVHPGLKEGDLSTQGFEVPPVVRDLDGDGVPEVVALGSEGDLLRAPGIGPGIEKVWLAVFKYRNGMFVSGSVGEKLDTPVQGFHLAADAAYLVTTEPSSMLGREGESHLVGFSLK